MAKVTPTQLYVPEKFYSHFLNKQVTDPTGVIAKLRLASPKPHGRGFTRIVSDLSSDQWEELYRLAVEGRSQSTNAVTGSHRSHVCANALSHRMEAIGVAKVAPPKRHKSTDNVKPMLRKTSRVGGGKTIPKVVKRTMSDMEERSRKQLYSTLDIIRR